MSWLLTNPLVFSFFSSKPSIFKATVINNRLLPVVHDLRILNGGVNKLGNIILLQTIKLLQASIKSFPCRQQVDFDSNVLTCLERAGPFGWPRLMIGPVTSQQFQQWGAHLSQFKPPFTWGSSLKTYHGHMGRDQLLPLSTGSWLDQSA